MEFYKIGVANDPEARLTQLQTGNPYKLEITSCYEFQNADVVEKALHQAFGEKRHFLEWFKISGADFDRFKKICELLGGISYLPSGTLTDDDIEEAEGMQEAIMEPPKKWDYQEMMSNGWRINRANGGGGSYYWIWRRGSGKSREYMYGGRLSDLPYPIEEMRQKYGK